MLELLRIPMPGSDINPLAAIVAQIFHVYEVEAPDVYQLNQLFGSEQIVAGEPTVQLLRRGLSVRTIGRYDHGQFLTSGPQHLQEITQDSWTAEQLDMFYAVWTREKVEYWQGRVRGWLEAYREAGENRQQEVRGASLEDIYDALASSAVVVVTLQFNPIEITHALLFGLTENGYFDVYCPVWGNACYQTRSRHHFLQNWKQDAGIHIVSR